MSDFNESTQVVSDELACSGCGAILKFKPGTHHLSCEYCGAETEIGGPLPGEVEELPLDEYLAQGYHAEEKIEINTVKCDSCGATSTLERNITSDKCPFCASNLVVKDGTTQRVHKPQYLLPFSINENKAIQIFRQWIRKLWFAPKDLKHYGDRADRLTGIYLPYWTFDCSTDSTYSGQKGIDYTVTESYTTFENGKNVTRQRNVTKTRWYSASGTVNNSFDDVLIEASVTLPKDKLRILEPWNLKGLVDYNDKYLSGFKAEAYDLDVRKGYAEAKLRMDPTIRQSICHDIGGDRQRINFVNTTYHDPTFKHILLPLWLSAFRYKNKVYQFMINAQTGEITGQRPYSTTKILLAVLGGLCILAIIYLLNR